MDELLLPLVEALVAQYVGPDFSNVKIIGAQHILETTHSMFRSLYGLGLKPENISIIGKCYSTCEEVYEEMLADGIDVSPASFNYSSHTAFDELYMQDVSTFLASRLHEINANQYRKVIVLDDGGKCINFFTKNLKAPHSFIAIEQTTAGYEAIKHSCLQFPVINVARSPVKLQLESPMIAQAAAERLYQSLSARNLKPERALIIGGGAIGQSMFERLSMDMGITIFDLNRGLSTYNPQDFIKALASAPLIIGCTGKTSVSNNFHKHIMPGATIVSVSSSDREFDAVHLRRRVAENAICHQDLWVDDIHLVRSGFPVNFDGERENIDPMLIQLTIALITAGILQANQTDHLNSALYPINEQYEKTIYSLFKEKHIYKA